MMMTNAHMSSNAHIAQPTSMCARFFRHLQKMNVWDYLKTLGVPNAINILLYTRKCLLRIAPKLPVIEITKTDRPNIAKSVATLTQASDILDRLGFDLHQAHVCIEELEARLDLALAENEILREQINKQYESVDTNGMVA